MNDKVTLVQLAPSFNSRKVRIALKLKGVNYDTIDTADGDTSAALQMSGQPMSPVLKHGDTVMFDSGAIVRYIDANFDGPRLFSADLDEMRAIEGWERRAMSEILPPFMRAMKQVRSGNMNAGEIAAGKEGYSAIAAKVESKLNEHGVLVGDHAGAADAFCACYLAYGFIDEEEAAPYPALSWCRQNFALDRRLLVRLREWYETLRA